MMNPVELDAYFTRIGLPQAGRRLVEKARRESPVREVQSRLGNVLSHYPSRKMQRVVVPESLHVEFPAFIQYEHDPDVLEYYPQPVMLDLRIIDPFTKKVSRIQHTPDVLLLSRDCIRIDEWREEARLQKLATKHPGRFTRDGRRWNCPQVEAHLHEFGIQYRLRTPDEHPRTLVQNLLFLSDYYAPEAPTVSERALSRMRECIAEHGAITISDLIDLGQPGNSSEVPHG
jgi:putative transposase